MKNFYQKAILGMAILSSFTLQAQNKNVGIGTSQPDQSAVLDIQSADKGLLIPRMNLEQRNAISNPADGLLIYQTTDKNGFYYFDSKSWKPLTENEAKSVATLDANGWALDGNASATANKAAATASSFIGTPGNVPINFRIGSVSAGTVDPRTNKQNTFLGFNAGNAGVTYVGANGNGNVGVGTNVLSLNTSGYRNLGFGRSALYNNTTGYNNVALGTSAMFNNTTGVQNTAIGGGALFTSTTGSFNMAFGENALYHSTGSFNMALGQGAGFNKTGNQNLYLGYNAGASSTVVAESNKLFIANSNTENPLIKGDFADKHLRINVGATNGTPNTATTTGYMAIGNFDAASPMAIPSGYRLVVESGILTEKIKVALKNSSVGGDWADYVFEPDYKLLPLEEVEKFTLENKHLPNVPSAEEMVNSGLDVAETSKMFMEKIEELTLYMIELNKEVKGLKVENEVLKAKMK